ncbi:electron transfer flavoprotein subunit alpha/FixB family protein [Pseudomonas putida]
MTGVLVFADVQDGQLQATSFELAEHAVRAAKAASTSVTGALIGPRSLAETFNPEGVANVLVAELAQDGRYDADAWVAAAQALIARAQPDLVLFALNGETVEWVPRVAARLDAGLVTGCSAVAFSDARWVASKAACGGAFLADYGFQAPLAACLMALGGGAQTQAGAAVSVEVVEFALAPARVVLLETVAEETGNGPALKTAKVVVSGGVGVGSAQNWQFIDQAAAGIGAAIGASRAAVDMGWVPSTRQVGFSGLKINAELYIAAGISGAIHHLAGLGRVKHIVAINEDPQASIFNVARYGVVGDLKAVLPAFVARVNELKAQ